MKIRTGFVSNSSSSSFCIIGWELKPIDWKDNSAFDKRQNITKEMFDFLKKNGFKYDIAYVDDGYSDMFGVGNYETDIDHYMEDWEDYIADPPSKESEDKIRSLRKEFEEKFKEELVIDSFGRHSDTYRA